MSHTAEQHRQAVAAIQDLFARFPQAAARWLWALHDSACPPEDLDDAVRIHQPPKSPVQVVAEKRDPKVACETHFREMVARMIADEPGTREPGVEVGLLDADLTEEMRQTLFESGCDIELLIRMRDEDGLLIPALLGVPLPGPDDDGSDMPAYLLDKVAWQIMTIDVMARRYAPHALQQGQCFGFVPIYLWPGTGLKDVQEQCCFFPRAAHDPSRGVRGIRRPASRDQDDEDEERDRELHLTRRDYHARRDEERRAAAARRRERTGDAGITDEELAALVPPVDKQRDWISLRITYEVVRLWDTPAEEWIELLPGELLGLALFGYRAPGVSIEEVLRRCAWALRRRLPVPDRELVEDALDGLAEIAAVHLDELTIRRTLAMMRPRR